MPLNDTIEIIKIKTTFDNFLYSKDHPILSPKKNAYAFIRGRACSELYDVFENLDRCHELQGQNLTFDYQHLDQENLIASLNGLYKNALLAANQSVTPPNQTQKSIQALHIIRKLRRSYARFAFKYDLDLNDLIQDDDGIVERLKAFKHAALTIEAIGAINQALTVDNKKTQNRWLAELVKLGYELQAPTEALDTREDLKKYLLSLQQSIVDTVLTESETQIPENKQDYRRLSEWDWVEKENENSRKIEKLNKAKKCLQQFSRSCRLPLDLSTINGQIKKLETDSLLLKVCETYRKYQWSYNRYWFVHFPKDVVTWLRGRSGDTTFYNLVTRLGNLIDLNSINFNPNQNTREALVNELNRVYNLALDNALTSTNLVTDENKKIKTARNTLREIKKLRQYYCEFALANGLDLRVLIQGSNQAIEKLKALRHNKKTLQAAAALNQSSHPDSKKIKNKWLARLHAQGYSIAPPNFGETPSKKEIEDYCSVLNANVASQPLAVHEKAAIEKRNHRYRFLIKCRAVKPLTENAYHVAKLREAKKNLQSFYYEHRLKEDFHDNIDAKIKELRDNNGDYQKEYATTKQFIEDFKNSPWRTAFRHKFLPNVLNKNHNQQIYLIIKHLCEMRLRDHVQNLMENFLAEDKKAGTEAEKLQKFLDVLYATFNALSIQDNIRRDDMKRLKKLIHTFAEQNDFDKKIFNLRRAYRKKQEDDEVTEKLTQQEARAYGYLRNSINKVNGKKVKVRRQKKILNVVSFLVTVVVALGEGIIAAIFLGPVALPLILIVGFCGFDVNYFLFRKDSFEALKQLFITGIFKDANGYEISTQKKALITGTVIFSVAIAVVFGSFTFNTAVVAITALLAAASLACPPAVIALAAFLAVVAVVANATMFYVMMADFVKNDRIKQVAAYFKRNFVDVWKQPKEWQGADSLAISVPRKIWHYFTAGLSCFINAAFMLVGVTACALITAVTLGLGHTQGLAFIDKIATLAPQVKDLITNVVVSAFAMPLNSYFYWRGMFTTLEAVKGIVYTIARKVTSPFKTAYEIHQDAIDFKNNPLRSLHVVGKIFWTVFHGTAAVFNSVGQGGGPYHDAASIDNVQKVAATAQYLIEKFGVNASFLEVVREVAAPGIAGGIAGFGSYGVNTLQITRALQMPELVYVHKLCPEVQDMITRGVLTHDQAKVISHVSDAADQIQLAERAVTKALSITDVAALVKKIIPAAPNSVREGILSEGENYAPHNDKTSMSVLQEESQNQDEIRVVRQNARDAKEQDDAILLHLPGSDDHVMEKEDNVPKFAKKDVITQKYKGFAFFNSPTGIGKEEDMQSQVDRIFEL